VVSSDVVGGSEEEGRAHWDGQLGITRACKDVGQALKAATKSCVKPNSSVVFSLTRILCFTLLPLLDMKRISLCAKISVVFVRRVK